MRPGMGRFETIYGQGEQRPVQASRPYLRPRARETLVIVVGQAFVVEEQSLIPWRPAEELRSKGFGEISGVYDAPTLQAAVVVDRAGRMHVLSDDGRWTTSIAQLDDKDHGSVADIPSANAALFMANRSITAIRGSGTAGYEVESLARGPRVSFGLHRSKLFGAVLQYAGAGIFDSKQRWRHLRPGGWEDISGGDVGIAAAHIFPQGHIRDLPTIRRTLVFGRDRLILYDGATMAAVPNSGPDRLGDLPRLYDLPSIGRVLLSTDSQVLEFLPDGQLIPRATPFGMEGKWNVNFVDWPHAGVAAVSTPQGVFTVGRDLMATLIPGSRRAPPIEFGIFPHGQNPGTGELMISGSDGMFLIIDKRRSDAAACEAALRNE